MQFLQAPNTNKVFFLQIIIKFTGHLKVFPISGGQNVKNFLSFDYLMIINDYTIRTLYLIISEMIMLMI